MAQANRFARTELLSWLVALAFAALLVGCRRQAEEPMPFSVGQLLRSMVEGRRVAADRRQADAPGQAWRDLRTFYRKRLYLPAWSDIRGPLPRAEELLGAIDGTAVEALDPRLYRREQLATLIGATRAAVAPGSGSGGSPSDSPLADPAVQRRVVDLDVRLSYAYLVMAEHLGAGRVRPQALPVSWHTRPAPVEADLVLQTALNQGTGIAASLAELAPASEGYKRLRQALASYRELAGRGGWPLVPPGAELKPGDSGERVAALRTRLAATGDLPQAAPSGATGGVAAATGGPALFDSQLAAAVARFRARHGLDEAQTVDAATLAALNVPVAARLRQIELNMERWRWLPGDLGERYVLVNIPDFRLQVVEAGRVALAMRVIVGKEQTKTPAFSDQMTELVLNPAWTLPDSIIAKEVVPHLASDPDYLQRKGFQVVPVKKSADEEGAFGGVRLGAGQLAELGRPGSPYRLRQPPGGENPLGKIKFLFPNRFDVYLHDTPTHHLFNRSEREFSHGCIRLEKPMDLAAYLLRGDPKWTPQAVDEHLASGKTTTIALRRPIPVHILYWTAWVDPDGTVQFRDDIYGHDATLAQALATQPPIWLNPTRTKSVRQSR